MLNVRNLTCIRDERVLFENLSFSLGAGEALRVEGSNGTGKTTLLRILAGLYEDYEGEVDWALDEFPLYVGHKPGVKDLLTATENLTWLSALQEGQVAPDAVRAALAQVNLRGFEDVSCGSMSEGQRKRVNLARLYLTRASAWILDEPFSAIDVSGIAALEERMNDHVLAGGLLLLITHQQLQLDCAVRSLRLGV
ncbi:MAG: cytochrome c biogenesis heme-transporting ATPase CcmA [Pseudomonadales bacterium]|nr:cytochrome c biogenesis heme-transporting ATPase CcmA [Pseudomonadales bacterium]